MANVSPVVIDLGSGMTKSGFAGDDAPRSVFPSIVGRPRYLEAMVGFNAKDSYVGDDAQARRGMFAIKYPLVNGVVENWDDTEKLLAYIFRDELRIDPTEHPILLTDSPLGPKSNREKMTQVIFETFNVPATYVTLSAYLALYAAGRGAGVVVDSGDGGTTILPIWYGYSITKAIKHIPIGGRDVTNYLSLLLRERNISLEKTAERENVRQIKEHLGYISLKSPLLETPPSSTKQYELPDGKQISLDSELYRCTEMLFNPASVGIEQLGIHSALYDTIMKSDIDLRRDLIGNIVLTGGSTMFTGFADRLQSELTSLLPSAMKIKIITDPARKYYSWIGGSILASLSTFQQMWISKEEYDEVGPQIVHRKCMFNVRQ